MTKIRERCKRCLEKENCCCAKVKKEICPKTASSVLCKEELLKGNGRLKLICQNGSNRYYHVNGSNTVIMLVELEHCILIDYEVVMKQTGKKVVLPEILSQYRYGIYQNKKNRNIVRGPRGTISYDIMKIIHGVKRVKKWRKNKQTLDHECETYNEKKMHIKLKKNNINQGSHQVRPWIHTKRELDSFISRAIQAEKEGNGVYFDKRSGKPGGSKTNHGSKFVELNNRRA